MANYQLVLIPGLGVDERLFSCLTLNNHFPQTVLKWVPPKKNENLTVYATRLLPQIPKDKNIILIGVSFGGIIAVELAKILSPALTILISSIKTRLELPVYYRVAGACSLPHLLPLSWIKNLYAGQNFFFGPKTDTEKKLLHQIIRETDIDFVKWALTQIARWPNKIKMPNLVHIHGTKDKLLPVRYIQNYISIKNGEHFMIMSKAAQISQIINKELERLPAL